MFNEPMPFRADQLAHIRLESREELEGLQAHDSLQKGLVSAKSDYVQICSFEYTVSPPT